jgi:hypothetical protein
MAWIILGISSFYVGGPSSSDWSGGAIPWYEVYGSPAICQLRELIISRVLGVTGGPRYPRHITPTVALEPSVEWVAGAGHSTMGGTGTHMVLWALMRDLAAKLRG